MEGCNKTSKDILEPSIDEGLQNIKFKKLKWLLFIVILLIPIFVAVKWSDIYNVENTEDLSKFTIIDTDVYNLFNTYDEDNDGYLTPAEFQKAYKNILPNENEYRPLEKPATITSPLEEENFVGDVKKFFEEQTFKEDVEVIELNVTLKPFDLLTMKKFIDDPVFFTYDEVMYHLVGLSSWDAPHIPSAKFHVSNFTVLLPRHENVAVGDTWEPIPKVLANGGLHLSQKRYTPPALESAAELFFFRLISMLHPNAFLHMRFPPRGMVACLRAKNQHYYHIMFRFHPEFQLNTPPRYPFWFTPAAFIGNIIIKKDGSHIQHFDMNVPKDKRLNVDMEWITGVEENSSDGTNPGEVDIGYVEEMRINSSGPSRFNGMNSTEPLVFTWTREIDFTEGLNILEKQFYPFKEVRYIPFNETLKEARLEEKLIHHILLWGSLDDQSC